VELLIKANLRTERDTMLSARIHEYYKQYTHYGGTKDPLIVHWPEGIKDGGKIRPQFHHAIRYNLIVAITRWEYASKQ